jgi:hypothetical protein
MPPDTKTPVRALLGHHYLDVVVAIAAFCLSILLADIQNAVMRIAVALERERIECVPRR